VPESNDDGVVIGRGRHALGRGTTLFQKGTSAGRAASNVGSFSEGDVGPLAVRNLEETDPQYSEWLIELDYAFRNWSGLS